MTGENGKRGKPLYGSRSLLNMPLSLHHRDYLGLVISLMVITPLVYHTIHDFVLGQCYQSSLVSLTCSREVTQLRNHHPVNVIHCNTSNFHFFMTAIPEPCVVSSFFTSRNHLLHFVSQMWDTSRPSYDESLLVDISSLSKKLTQKQPFQCFEACIPQWQVSHFQRQVDINGLRSKDFGVRHRIMYSHHVNCTVVP